jgi:voltage-gated potassium channel Kch
LSETGRHIVENLRNAGERVVAIDLDSDTPAAAACAQAGVPVLKGDATSAKILRLAGAHRAKAIVATTGSDSTNLEISLRANDLESARHLVVCQSFGPVGFGIRSPIISAPHWAPRRWRSDLSTPATIQRGALSLFRPGAEADLVCFRAAADSPVGTRRNGRGGG